MGSGPTFGDIKAMIDRLERIGTTCPECDRLGEICPSCKAIRERFDKPCGDADDEPCPICSKR